MKPPALTNHRQATTIHQQSCASMCINMQTNGTRIAYQFNRNLTNIYNSQSKLWQTTDKQQQSINQALQACASACPQHVHNSKTSSTTICQRYTNERASFDKPQISNNNPPTKRCKHMHPHATRMCPTVLKHQNKPIIDSKMKPPALTNHRQAATITEQSFASTCIDMHTKKVNKMHTSSDQTQQNIHK